MDGCVLIPHFGSSHLHNIWMAFMCLIFLVIVHPGLVNLILQLLPLWSSDQCPITIHCIHIGRTGICLWASTCSFGCLSISTIRLHLSLSHNSGFLLNFDSVSFNGLLKKSVARLSNLGMIGIYLICNKVIHMLALVS